MSFAGPGRGPTRGAGYPGGGGGGPRRPGSAARRPGGAAAGAAPQELVRKLADLERESATRLREYKELAGALEASRAETAGARRELKETRARRKQEAEALAGALRELEDLRREKNDWKCQQWLKGTTGRSTVLALHGGPQQPHVHPLDLELQLAAGEEEEERAAAGGRAAAAAPVGRDWEAECGAARAELEEARAACRAKEEGLRAAEERCRDLESKHAAQIMLLTGAGKKKPLQQIEDLKREHAAELRKHRSHVEELEDKVHLLQTSEERAVAAKMKLASSMQVEEREAADLRRQLDEAAREAEANLAEVMRVNAEYDSLAETNRENAELVAELQKRLRDGEEGTRARAEESKALKRQLRRAEAEALEHRGKAEGLEAEIAALRADAAESRKVLNTVSTIQAKAQKELEAELKAAKDLSAGYKAELEAAAEEAARLAADKERLEARCSEVSEGRTVADAQSAALKSGLEGARAELRDATRQLADAEGLCRKLQAENSSLSSQVLDHQVAEEKRSKLIGELELQKADLSDRVRKTQGDRVTRMSEIKRLEDENRELEARVRLLQDREAEVAEAHARQVEAMEHDRANLVTQNEGLERRLEAVAARERAQAEAQSELAELRRAKEDLAVKFQFNEKLLEEMRDTQRRLQKQVAAGSEEQSSHLKRLQRDLEQAELAKNAAVLRGKKAEQELCAKVSEINALDVQLKELKKRNEKGRSKLEAMRRADEDTARAHREQLDGLERKAARLARVEAELRKAKEDLADEAEGNRTLVKRLEAEMAQVSEVHGLQEKVAEKDAKVRALEADLAGKAKEMQRIQQSCEKVSEQLTEEFKRSSRLQAELAGLREAETAGCRECAGHAHQLAMLSRSTVDKDIKLQELQDRLKAFEQAGAAAGPGHEKFKLPLAKAQNKENHGKSESFLQKRVQELERELALKSRKGIRSLPAKKPPGQLWSDEELDRIFGKLKRLNKKFSLKMGSVLAAPAGEGGEGKQLHLAKVMPAALNAIEKVHYVDPEGLYNVPSYPKSSMTTTFTRGGAGAPDTSRFQKAGGQRVLSLH